jgi:hypothetical protein
MDKPSKSQPIEDLVRALPSDLQEKVREYVESLLSEDGGRTSSIGFAWAGALKDLRGQYTSVDLQHQISCWRVGGDETPD